MNSFTFPAVASAALFVLVFQGGEAGDVALHDGSGIGKGHLENANHSVSPFAASNRKSQLGLSVMNTPQRSNGKVSCGPTVIRGDYVILPNVGAYKIHQRKLTWNEARKVCLAEGAQLAQVDTARKDTIFKVWIMEKGLSGLWLGFHDQFEEGSWVTMTGESMDTLSYHPWAKGEPNNDGEGQNCGVLWHSGVDDYQCDRKEPFLCEINLCETIRPAMLDTSPTSVE